MTVYHNRGDKAMYVSDYTKGNPERLGTNGAAHPATLHNKVHQVDCSAFAGEGTDFVQHSYQLRPANLDIRHGIGGLANDDKRRNRRRRATCRTCGRLVRKRVTRARGETAIGRSPASGCGWHRSRRVACRTSRHA